MILASASPRRIELMHRAGFCPRVMPADVDERRLAGETPLELVARLARMKALAMVEKAEVNELVVGADTIVWMGDEALGKPASLEQAKAMLAELSGRVHHVSTGCAMALRAADGPVADETFTYTTDVRFFDLEPAEISSYVASGECLDKAGAYAIQGLGSLLVRDINGNYDNVVGLPVAELSRRMRSFLHAVGTDAS